MDENTQHSKRGKLNKTDWLKVAKGAVIAGIAAALAYVMDIIGMVEVTPEVVQAVGDASEPMVVDGIPPMVVWWMLSIGVNLLRKLFSDNPKGE